MNVPVELLSNTKVAHPEIFGIINAQWGMAEMDTTLEHMILAKPPCWPEIVVRELVNLYITHKDHYTFAPICK
jgi:hypothetical protein